MQVGQGSADYGTLYGDSESAQRCDAYDEQPARTASPRWSATGDSRKAPSIMNSPWAKLTVSVAL